MEKNTFLNLIADFWDSFTALKTDSTKMKKHIKTLEDTNAELRAELTRVSERTDRLNEACSTLCTAFENVDRGLSGLVVKVDELEANLGLERQRNQTVSDQLQSLIKTCNQQSEAFHNLTIKAEKHFEDETRHIRRINGATEKNLANASKANKDRGHLTNEKIFRAIICYLETDKDKTKVDMTWLIQATGYAESTIRLAVKDLQEHRLDEFIRRKENGEYTFYGLNVPQTFIRWQKNGTFFNIPKK